MNSAKTMAQGRKSELWPHKLNIAIGKAIIWYSGYGNWLKNKSIDLYFGKKERVRSENLAMGGVWYGKHLGFGQKQYKSAETSNKINVAVQSANVSDGDDFLMGLEVWAVIAVVYCRSSWERNPANKILWGTTQDLSRSDVIVTLTTTEPSITTRDGKRYWA